MANNINHHMYQDETSKVWYFQKKVRGREKPYKLSLGTKFKTEARRKRDEYLKQIEQNGVIDKVELMETPSITLFGEVAMKWSKIVETQIAETTLQNYKKVMNKHVLPEFGNYQIDAIKSLDIESFTSTLTCGSKTKQNILTPFRLVMKFAKRHNIIQSNPFKDVEPIKKTKNEQKRPLTMDEIRLFINNVDEFWKPLFIVLFFSGIRIAEATALKWKRVDLVNGVIKIRRNLVRLKGGKIVYKKPKTDSSVRDVKVPGFVVEALREQRKRTLIKNGDDFVFLNKRGTNIHRHTINRLVLKPTLKSLGISTPISIKDTRVSFITNALDQNERMSYIQKQVGHTTTRMIVDHYYRYVPAPDDGDKLENAWNSTSFLPE